LRMRDDLVRRQNAKLQCLDKGKIRLRRNDVENLVSKGYNTMALLRTFHLWQMHMYCSAQYTALSSMLNETCEAELATTVAEESGMQLQLAVSPSTVSEHSLEHAEGPDIEGDWDADQGEATIPKSRRLYLRALGESLERAESLGSIKQQQEEILKETLDEVRTYADLIQDCLHVDKDFGENRRPSNGQYTEAVLVSEKPAPTTFLSPRRNPVNKAVISSPKIH